MAAGPKIMTDTAFTFVVACVLCVVLAFRTAVHKCDYLSEIISPALKT